MADTDMSAGRLTTQPVTAHAVQITMAIVTVMLCCWILLFPHLLDEPSPVPETLPTMILGLSSGLLLATGLLLAGRWRLIGDHCAGAAAAAILFGLGLPVLSIAGPLLQLPEAATGAHITTARLLIIFPVLMLLVAGCCVRAWPLPPPLIAGAVFVGWLAAIAALIVSPNHGSWLWSSARAVALHAIACGIWLFLSRRAWTRAQRDGRPPQHWIAFSLALLGTCSLAQAWTSLDRQLPTELVPLLQLAAAAAAVAAAGIELHANLRVMAGQRVAVADSLGHAHALLSQTEREHRQRVHDARTAVVGLDAAARLLIDRGEATSVQHERIQALMSAELDRLRDRLDPDLVEPIMDFGLNEILQPVLFAHQLCGAPLRCELGDVRALGRPSATATVVANLLANVRAHTSGAAVEIRAVRAGGRVHVFVEDDGPGIAAEDRARIMRCGARGSAPGPGSGLGLYTALTAMTSQAGSLQIGRLPRGGTRITLSLPAPSAVAAVRVS